MIIIFIHPDLFFYFIFILFFYFYIYFTPYHLLNLLISLSSFIYFCLFFFFSIHTRILQIWDLCVVFSETIIWFLSIFQVISHLTAFEKYTNLFKYLTALLMSFWLGIHPVGPTFATTNFLTMRLNNLCMWLNVNIIVS